jgi:putative transposase
MQGASSRSRRSSRPPSMPMTGAGVLGMDIGPSEVETFRAEFLRKLAKCGLHGVRVVISDAHEELKAAITEALHATWQRCRVHLTCNLLAQAGKHGPEVVAAFIATAFAQEEAASTHTQWRQIADQLRPKVAKPAAMMDEVEVDVLDYMGFPKDYLPPDAAQHQPDRASQRRGQGASPRSGHLPR